MKKKYNIKEKCKRKRNVEKYQYNQKQIEKD